MLKERLCGDLSSIAECRRYDSISSVVHNIYSLPFYSTVSFRTQQKRKRSGALFIPGRFALQPPLTARRTISVNRKLNRDNITSVEQRPQATITE
ncbi:hypothetical protein F2P81_012043 [Scophthalmus maximus]|uniref:Uncharacterized protein n=1 Tax=Scophthalmus maximus TaxID=52904 RepID=A0A6A4T0D4_SCOMX|nr:hypothetical protein F2P81_012043 [Scophthalmus maximus]